MTSDERFWGIFRFTLLMIFSVIGLFTVICKFFITVPIEDSSEIMADINNSEKIFAIQKEYTQRAAKIWNDIDSLDYNTHQVQRMDEVKEEIVRLQDIYQMNNANSKYLFGILLSRSLKYRFDCGEEYNSLINNNKLIEKDLEECKANL